MAMHRSRRVSESHFCLLLFLFLLNVQSLTSLATKNLPRTASKDGDLFDLVIIGAGASGLFAAGAALSFGSKTLLLDQGKGFVGGDCSNAACVPSKALRSIARIQNKGILDAQEYTLNTVMAVRKREDIINFENVTNLELVLVESSKFVSDNEMEIVPRDGNLASRRVRAKKFLIATGASPILPSKLKQEASVTGLPLFTYRDILSPSDSENDAWAQFVREQKDSVPTIIIAGGGPTAVELGQALSRLQMNITMITPTALLPAEDVSLQKSACQILRHDGANLCFGRRVVGITNAAIKCVVLDDGTQLAADALLVCAGREPTIKSLDLDAGGIAWDSKRGVEVHPSSLQSRTNARVFACGDCCSSIQGKDRKAAHAAWTGYFAIRNLSLPKILWIGSRSTHPTVPSVTYADPELASVGMTRSECIFNYGQRGFVHLTVREEGNDRADMERGERFVDPCFVELRTGRLNGRILGLTACGPAAAELANEVGLAIQSKLTVRDLARSIHSYPSHGYLLYRLSLSMALSSIRGFLDTLGPICKFGGKCYGSVAAVASILQPNRLLPWRRAKQRRQQQWEAYGQQRSFIHPNQNASQDLPMSFLEYYESQENTDAHSVELPEAFIEWLDQKPE